MDLAINDNNDLYLDGQDLALTTIDTEVVQSLKIRLQFVQGEWFLNLSAGVPYIQQLFEIGTSIETMSQIFTTEILNTDGVSRLTSLVLEPDLDTRKLSITFTAILDNELSIDQNIEIRV